MAGSSQQWTIARFGLLIVLAGAYLIGTVTVIVAAAWWLKRANVFQPEILLPLLLIAGVVTLLGALSVLVAAFHLFNLTNPTKAFGVPEGTLQAVIALALILIFAITSLYLRGSLNANTVKVNGLTAKQLAQIPGSEVVQTRRRADGLVNVERRVPVDPDAKDFSKQLLTILGTLVVAVAGFYFGAKSVETGVSAGSASIAPESTAPPVITGEPRVGEPLTAEVGGWTGSPPPSYSHQWSRKTRVAANWTDVPGANLATFIPSGDDAGKIIRLAVTARNTEGDATAYSAPTNEVVQAPNPLEPPRIEGELREDEELQADRGKWSAWPEPKYSFGWERYPPDGDWAPIPGARTQRYRLTRDDVGARVRIVVTAKNAEGDERAYSRATEPIEGAALNVEIPTISGTAIEGSPLTAEPGSWTGWPLVYAYQWERSDPTQRWTVIPNAKAKTYLLSSDDVGREVRVAVTASGVEEHSASTGTVGGAPTNTEPPHIEGVAKEGERLQATTGEWGGSPEPSFQTQWQRQPSGMTTWTDITGATDLSYAVSREDVAARLRVRVLAANSHGDALADSEPTAPVEGSKKTLPESEETEG